MLPVKGRRACFTRDGIPFLQDLKKYGATTVVRVCEVTYDKAPLEKDGITVVVSLPPLSRWRPFISVDGDQDGY